jgi:dihydroorotase
MVLVGGVVYDGVGLVSADLAIEDGCISEVKDHLAAEPGDVVIDCSQKVVAPAFLDLHSHLRWPDRRGFVSPEEIADDAIAGGFGTLVAMANTDPVIDTPLRMRRAVERYRDLPVTVYQASAATIAREGVVPVDFPAMIEAGAAIFSDDGSGIQRSDVMAQVLSASSRYGFVLAQHAQDNLLSGKGVMNYSRNSERFGLAGMPEVAESAMVARDLELIKAIGGQMHFMHLSSRESLNLIRQAKRDGLKVTAEVTPHHLLLDDDHIKSYDSRFKMNPPLRSKSTVMALVNGLLDGSFDALATDHAPHPRLAKEIPFEQAAFGVVGLRDAFAVAYTAALDLAQPMEMSNGRDGSISATRLDLESRRFRPLTAVLGALTNGPASVLGKKNSISTGARANITVVDPNASYLVSGRRLDWCNPYLGKELTGTVDTVILDGKIKVRQGEKV